MAKEVMHTEKAPKIPQPDAVTMPELDENFAAPSNIVKPQDAKLNKQYLDDLAMAEDPVTFRIEPMAGEFAPKVVDCWVNGKGAELLQNGRWVEYGAFPVGYSIITKRKYLEVLARNRHMTIRTRIEGEHSERPVNHTERTVTRTAAFSIEEDKNPKGIEWARRMMSYA